MLQEAIDFIYRNARKFRRKYPLTIAFRLKKHSKILAKHLNDPEFKKEWDALDLQFQIVHELMKARIETNMTQAQLAEKSGVRQSNISRIESGSVLPKLETLDTLAKAMGKHLKISFE